MHYSLLSGGKRVRAAAVPGSDPGRRRRPAAGAAGGRRHRDGAGVLAGARRPAGAGRRQQRRGRPTSHVRYGEAVAVLVRRRPAERRLPAGRSGWSAPATVRLAVLAELAGGVAGMIDGQYLDVTAAAPGDLDGLRAPAPAEDRRADRGLRGLRPARGRRGPGPARALPGLRRRAGAALPDRRRRAGRGRDGEPPATLPRSAPKRARELARESHGRALELLGGGARRHGRAGRA